MAEGAGMLQSTLLRWRVAVQTALIVLGIIAVKLAIAAFSLKFISISPLFTSVVAGGPSAHLLIESIVVIIIIALSFMEIEPTYEAVIILGFISFFFISLLRLLRIMDRPFHVEEHTSDDVSLFLLRGFVERLNRTLA